VRSGKEKGRIRKREKENNSRKAGRKSSVNGEGERELERGPRMRIKNGNRKRQDKIQSF